MKSSSLANFFSFGRKIIGVGRNYEEHAAELKNAVPTEPVLFLKPSTSYLSHTRTGGVGSKILFPPGCKELHHEVELGVVIEKPCSHLSASEKSAEIMKHVGGYCVALDMTARDFQSKAKKAGLPWSVAKGFDTSCPVGSFLPAEKIEDPHNLDLWCTVDGEMRQAGNTSNMIFKIPELLCYITRFFSLEPGDLILTGTPAGVGPVVPGSVIEAGITGLSASEIKFDVGPYAT